MPEIKAGTLRADMKTVAILLVTLLLAAFARADDTGCVQGPVLTPALQTASDLRCFEPTFVVPRSRVKAPPADPLPFVLAGVGAGAIATAIGFGVGAGQAGDANTQHVESVVATFALSIGVTALVTAVVLAIIHR
jgi:hypothetical protein